MAVLNNNSNHFPITGNFLINVGLHFAIIKCKFYNLTAFNLSWNDVTELGGCCTAQSQGHTGLELSVS